MRLTQSPKDEAEHALAATLTMALAVARDLPELARLAHDHARRAAGLDGLQLAWIVDDGIESARIDWQPVDTGAPRARLALHPLDESALGRIRFDGQRASLIERLVGEEGGSQVLLAATGEAQAFSQPAWRALFAALGLIAKRLLEVATLDHAVVRLRKAEQLQRALFAIADMAGADLDMPDMLRGLHEIVARLMYAENFYIVLYSATRQTLRFIYFADTQDAEPIDFEEERPVEAMGSSLTLAMIRQGRSMMGPSRELRARCGLPMNDLWGPDAEDWLGVPMMSGGEVRGAVVVQSYAHGRCYTEEDRALLSYVAQHILTALERKRAHEELERRVEQRTWELARANEVLQQEVTERQEGERLQAALFRIAELSATADTLDDFYAALHAIVGEFLYAKNFFIALITGDGRELEFPYARDERDTTFARRHLARGLTEYVLRSGTAALVDSEAIQRLAAQGEVNRIGPGAQCWLGVPLICAERTVGALVVQSYSPQHMFSPRDQDLLTFVSFHIASALERRRAQDSLRGAYVDLEHRVAERTQELAQANRELRDQVDERERAESRLKHQALHDALTGLPNRACLLDRLSHALSRCRRDARRQFAVLFLDLDRFKVINDSMGHLVGDEMLKLAGARIAASVREPDTVARLGGDEFAILLEDIAGEHDAINTAHRVIEALAEPMRVEGKELFTSASIGVALSHPRYTRAEELLRDADVAMYRAKARGRHRYEMFDEQLHTEALRVLDLEGDLRRAITRNEFEPYFQPIVNLIDGETVGYEALLRWRHNERGLLLPGDFLTIAEDSGSIDQIDWQMFDLTCREIPRLSQGGAYVCLNVSARHFRSPDLAETLLALLDARRVDPERVRLEVTEGALLDNPDIIRRTLQRLRDAGVRCQLDDFGTGYSSLSYLHRFPIHSVKIDRSFVADLKPGVHNGAASVVRAIQAMTRSLGLELIAEGIETTEQRDALIELGYEIGQGFLFAHPRPVQDLVGMPRRIATG